MSSSDEEDRVQPRLEEPRPRLRREGESLRDRVFRKAYSIAERRDNKTKYAAHKDANRSRCKDCNVYLNSAESRVAHYNGARHKKTVERLKEGGLKVCRPCGVIVRTKSEFDNHLRGRRHRGIEKALKISKASKASSSTSD